MVVRKTRMGHRIIERPRSMGPCFRRDDGRWYSPKELNATITDIDRMDRMAALTREQITSFVRGIGLRQVRLVSGLVLFAYLVSHFLNHALGNVSMEALASGVYLHTSFWQFLPVAILFYTACLVHTALGIWALYERRQF